MFKRFILLTALLLASSHLFADTGFNATSNTRPIFRKYGSIVTTANLGVSGVFTGPWIDTNGEGTIFVQAAAFSTQASALVGFELDETDDTTDSNFTRIINNVSVSTSVLTYVTGSVRGRYWRVKYTNGVIAQTSFKLTQTNSNNSPVQSVNQAVLLSPGNSSTAQLAAGATFTGLDDTTLGVGALQVNVFADQNLTVAVQQSADGSTWIVQDTWTYTSGSGGTDASRTIQATGSYIRVLVTNNGGSTTTTFQLQTVLAPIIEALPRALTQLGSLKVAENEGLSPAGVSASYATGATSYRAATIGITSAASATDVSAICGNSTNMILVYGLKVSCTQTVAGNISMQVVRRNTGYTGAWSTMTSTADDSQYAVAKSSAIFFTANPTVGTLSGLVDSYVLSCLAPATAA